MEVKSELRKLIKQMKGWKEMKILRQMTTWLAKPGMPRSQIDEGGTINCVHYEAHPRIAQLSPTPLPHIPSPLSMPEAVVDYIYKSREKNNEHLKSTSLLRSLWGSFTYCTPFHRFIQDPSSLSKPETETFGRKTKIISISQDLTTVKSKEKCQKNISTRYFDVLVIIWYNMHWMDRINVCITTDLWQFVALYRL